MNISGNALVMKELNIHLVRQALKRLQKATKQQIAEMTGLSTVTIGTILQKLVEEAAVFEEGLVASMGGRPAQQFRFNQDHAHVLVLFTHERDGLDVLHVRVVNLYGECVYEQDAPLSDIHLATFEPYIDAALQAYPTIQAVGFGLPGFEFGGKIIFLDYPALMGTDFIAHYHKRCGLPVIFENDVNAASLGYCKRSALSTEAAVLYLYFPQKYPPGGGIVINGRLYKGLHNYAGEVSMMPLGIDWRDASLYASSERVCEAIAKLIVAAGGLLNPHSVILHGKFLTAAHLEAIEHQTRAHLPPDSLPAIRLANNFTLDYQTGVIEETLALLEPPIRISQ